MRKINLDFNTPGDARKFLRELRLPNGDRIKYLILNGSRKVDIDVCSDDEAMDYASQLYTDLFINGDGSYYCEEEMIH